MFAVIEEIFQEQTGLERPAEKLHLGRILRLPITKGF